VADVQRIMVLAANF